GRALPKRLRESARRESLSTSIAVGSASAPHSSAGRLGLVVLRARLGFHHTRGQFGEARQPRLRGDRAAGLQLFGDLQSHNESGLQPVAKLIGTSSPILRHYAPGAVSPPPVKGSGVGASAKSAAVSSAKSRPLL